MPCSIVQDIGDNLLRLTLSCAANPGRIVTAGLRPAVHDRLQIV